MNVTFLHSSLGGSPATTSNSTGTYTYWQPRYDGYVTKVSGVYNTSLDGFCGCVEILIGDGVDAPVEKCPCDNVHHSIWAKEYAPDSCKYRAGDRITVTQAYPDREINRYALSKIWLNVAQKCVNALSWHSEL